ncbi:MAG: tRNA (adenosine(37)-N6)-threonylcarbamoyltransferase complex dimerization subunit type 1 TsaB [Eubacterium sp.]|nr:tRNA (adenosine(37)-N6)-threonylcarbamoyltransferase complex dimerization subunit type 1 TsaB [Eubacterium sp.]
MKILAIDSSGMPASVAVLTDGILEAEYTINNKLTHSQTLLPMIDQVSKMIGLDTANLDAIAIAAGPGSFTGLRIGSATAKGLGLALDKPIIEVPTCDALAFNLYRTGGLICPMMDARRSEVYTGIYRFEGDRFITVKEQTPLAVAEIAAELNRLGQEVTLAGDGVPVYLEKLKDLLTVPFYAAPAHLSRQRAGAVAALGARLFEAGKTVSAADHVPVYLRLSQAERERKEREEKGIAEGRYGKSTHL